MFSLCRAGTGESRKWNIKGSFYLKKKQTQREREMPQGGAQSWILVISELHRYQGVSYKSDIIVISGGVWGPALSQ